MRNSPSMMTPRHARPTPPLTPPASNRPPTRLSPPRRSRSTSISVAMWSAVAIGVALRVHQYLYDRALWLDEALLALNLLDEAVDLVVRQLRASTRRRRRLPGQSSGRAIELFRQKEYSAAPAAARLWIASVFVFKHIACKVLNRSAALLALILFSLSDRLIYYSSEVKQYSTDVFSAARRHCCVLDLQADLPRGIVSLLWASPGRSPVLFSTRRPLPLPQVWSSSWRRTSSGAGGAPARDRRGTARMGSCLLRCARVRPLAGLPPTGARSCRLLGRRSHRIPTELTFFRNFAGGLVDCARRADHGLGHNARSPIGVLAVVGAALARRRRPSSFAVAGDAGGGACRRSALHTYPVLPRTILFLVPLVIVTIGEGVLRSLRSSARATARQRSFWLLPSACFLRRVPANMCSVPASARR